MLQFNRKFNSNQISLLNFPSMSSSSKVVVDLILELESELDNVGKIFVEGLD